MIARRTILAWTVAALGVAKKKPKPQPSTKTTYTDAYLDAY